MEGPFLNPNGDSVACFLDRHLSGLRKHYLWRTFLLRILKVELDTTWQWNRWHKYENGRRTCNTLKTFVSSMVGKSRQDCYDDLD